MYKDIEYLKEQFIVKRRTVKSIADECGVSKSTIEQYLKRFSLKRGNIKNTIDTTKVKDSDEVLNYYLGLVITDGYMDKRVKRVSIRCKNEGSFEVFNALKNHFTYTGEVRVYEGGNDLTITSKELRDYFISKGVSPKGKQFNVFPKEFYSDSCARMFFRGLLDGDGNIHNKIFRITLSNKQFLEDMSEFLNTHLNLETVVKKDRAYWKIEMNVKDSGIFLPWLYEGFTEFSFKDKYKRYLTR